MNTAIKFLNILMIIICLTSIYCLFIVKNKVLLLNYQINSLDKQIEIEKDKINLLNAEFAYLTSPTQLKSIVAKQLTLQPIKTSQIIQDPLLNKDNSKTFVSVNEKHDGNKKIKWRYRKSINNYINLASSSKSFNNKQTVIKH